MSRALVETAKQGTLLEVLPAGVFLFRGMADRGAQERMRDELRDVARAAPLTTPQMSDGTSFRLSMTNAGAFGWLSERGHFHYSRTQTAGPCRGRRWPAIPATVLDFANRAAAEAGCRDFDPTNCLVNFYDKDGSLGLHRDDTPGENISLPVVTISLGDDALFDIGGLEKSDQARTVELNSGDVLVLCAVGRLYYHRVRRILAGTSDLLAKGGRISATLRRVGR